MSTVQQPVDNWVTGSDSYQTTLATIASGQNLPDKTPLGQITASGKLVKWAPAASDGSQVAKFITAYAVDASSADTQAQVIKTGTFNPELVNWPAGVTAAQKLNAFAGTPISLQLPT
jgi:hypothetical protein